jgi:hypothetical protein
MVTDRVEIGEDMLIVRGADVVVFPAASRAIAVKVYGPGVTPLVFQEREKGLVVSSAPRLFPFSRNWTPMTPVSSVAVAETVIVPLTDAPSPGAVRATVGGVVSGDEVSPS